MCISKQTKTATAQSHGKYLQMEWSMENKAWRLSINTQNDTSSILYQS